MFILQYNQNKFIILYLVSILINVKSVMILNLILLNLNLQKEPVKMYLSSSNISSINVNQKTDNKLNFLPKQPSSTANSKINVFPPKIHRNASYSSNLNLLNLLQDSTSSSYNHHSSLSNHKDNTPSKIYTNRNFSKNKQPQYLFPKTINSSFSSNMNSNSATNLNMSYQSKYNSNNNNSHLKDYSTNYEHRFSCYTDVQTPISGPAGYSNQFILNNHPSLYASQNSGYLGDMKKSAESFNINKESQIQKKLRQLQNKIKKNQESMKIYNDQVQHLKQQWSATENAVLHNPNFSKNLLSVSAKQPTSLSSNAQVDKLANNQQNDKQNVNNSNSANNDPLALSLIQFQKRSLKQIESLKKQIKKISSQEQILKGDMKMFQLSIKQVLTGFKQYISQSIEQLSKKTQKNKRRIFDKVNQQMQKKTKDIMGKELQPITDRISGMQKEMTDKIKLIETNKNCTNANNQKITKSKERFLKDPILIRIKQEVYGINNNNILSKQQHNQQRQNYSQDQKYKQMIKNNIYNSLSQTSIGSHFPAYQNMGSSSQTLKSSFDVFPSTFASSNNYKSTSLFPQQNSYLPSQSNNGKNINNNFLNFPSHQQISLQISQTTYYLDDEGYLLDIEGYYLLLVKDEKQQKIKLNFEQMSVLTKNGLIKNYTQ